jgi:phage terminase Nu1 subunit (DNA packaging protein)
MSRYDLGDALGVNYRTISRWERDGMPVEVPGDHGRPTQYSLPKVVAWRRAREVSLAAGSGEDGGRISLEIERAKLARQQARRTELDVRKREGGLVERAVTTAAWDEIVLTIRTRLLALPAELADACTAAAQAGGAAAVEVVLRRAIHDVLTELSRWKGATG